MVRDIRSRLMAGWGAGDPFDRHLFACAIAAALLRRAGAAHASFPCLS